MEAAAGGAYQAPVHAGTERVRWIWVSLAYATFALATEDGIVVDAAPVAKWAIGKNEKYVADYYRRKGARFAEI